MTAGELSFNLFVKMSEELRTFYEWLKTRPPDEILQHSYEYAVKVDIMAFIEQFNMDEDRTRALLSLDFPLESIYKAHNDKGLTTIERMMSTIEDYADEIREVHKANAQVPVYPHSEEHANAHGEWEIYQMSTHLDIQCREAVEKAISDYYALNSVDPEGIHHVVAQFGVDRVLHVLSDDAVNKPRCHPHVLEAYKKQLALQYPPLQKQEKKSVTDKLKVKPQKIRRNFRRISSKDQER